MEELLRAAPYAWDRATKAAVHAALFSDLTAHHYARCPGYRRILQASGVAPEAPFDRESLPFLPVRLFKDVDLRSVDAADVVKTMTSSGTTGGRVSRIAVDRETGALQTRALARIMGSLLGSARLPMIVFDTAAVVGDPRSPAAQTFSARSAAVRGFSTFARDRVFALDDDLTLDIARVEEFVERHRGERSFAFGFTYVLWQHVVFALSRAKRRLPLDGAVLVHGGGWKKMAERGVPSASFRAALRDTCGVTDVHDYYGMVEQTGAIHLECEAGHLHASNFGDVVVRRAHDFRPAAPGERGLVEVISVLPRSYPGHALLTEDEGALLGEDDCRCGRRGRYFRVFGRLPHAELRGCSDVHGAA